MNLTELNKIAAAMLAPGRGILAADESSGTIKKRFDAIGVESTPMTRRDYRELLFRSVEAMSSYRRSKCLLSGEDFHRHSHLSGPDFQGLVRLFPT